MKILLIGFNLQEDIFPLGLTSLKAYVQKEHPDITFDIEEFVFGNRAKYEVNSHLEVQMLSHILLKKPDLVCFSCYIWNAQLIKNLCKALKKISDIPIVLGGVEADENSREYCDYIIYGEGELKFKELIDHIKNNKKWDENESLIDDIDDIPFPYKCHDGKKEYTAVRVEGSRGCPFNCTYCYYAQRKYREHSIPYLRDAIAYLFDNYSFKHLTFIDSTFNLNKERMKEILSIIASHKKKVVVHLELKPELIDEECISIIKDSGLRVICELGLQSVSTEVLHICSRPFDIEKITKGLELLNSNNINYKIDMMYALPGDTFFRFLRTVNFLMKHSRQKLLPAHHTMILNNTKMKSSKNVVRFLDDSSSMVIQTETQSVVDIYKERLFLNMINSKRFKSKNEKKQKNMA